MLLPKLLWFIDWCSPKMGGGGSSTPAQTTQTSNTTATPWAGVQDYLKQLYASSSALANSGGPQLYPGSTIAPVSQQTQAGWNAGTAYATDQMPSVIQATQQGWLPLLSAGDINNNPYAQSAIQAAINPSINTLMQQVLPQLGSAANQQGAYSGERYPLAQSMAVESGMRSIGDTAASLAANLYGQGMDTQAKAVALGPQMASLGLSPGQALTDIGTQVQSDQTARLQEEANKYNYNQMLPYNMQSWLAQQLAGSAPLLSAGGSTSSTSSGTAQQESSADPTAAIIGGLLMAMMFA